MFKLLLANRFRIFAVFSNPLAVVFIAFPKLHGSYIQLFKAAWELQAAFLKPLGKFTQNSKRF
jgi:hypothetical protein